MHIPLIQYLPGQPIQTNFVDFCTPANADTRPPELTWNFHFSFASPAETFMGSLFDTINKRRIICCWSIRLPRLMILGDINEKLNQVIYQWLILLNNATRVSFSRSFQKFLGENTEFIWFRNHIVKLFPSFQKRFNCLM